jgi:hypothetical protein
LQLVSGKDAIVQNLRIRYQFFLGEWFLDTRKGIPYYEKILIKNPNRDEVLSILREVALETPGIETVDRFDADLDTTARELSVDLWALSDEDDPIDFSGLFIIGGAPV